MVSIDHQQIFDAALELPEKQRGELAERLWQSLSEDSQEDISNAWTLELDRRWKPLESGAETLLDGADVLNEMKSRCGAGWS